MQNKVEISGICTSSLPKVTQKEVEEMLYRIKNGEVALKDKFITCNLRLVLSVVKKFTHKKECMDDIFQIGCVGLIKAIDNFDINYNVRFSTYAVPMIIGEIRRYLRDNTTLRVSRSLKDIAYKALKLKETHQNENLSTNEIAELLNLPVQEVEEALEAIIEPASIYEAVFNSNGESVILLEQIYDTKNTNERVIEDIALAEAIKKLNEKERYVIDRRYYEGKTQIETAEELHISQAQISRIEKSALNHLKKQL